MMSEYQTELRQATLCWLSEPDATRKAAGVRQLAKDWSSGAMQLDRQAVLTAAQTIPGVPARPELVAPRLVKRRSMVTTEGRAILIHALVHIEFNAINLALDAIWRFADMPCKYYTDWLQVADEEALHFSLLAGHLQTLGHVYGDFPGHSSLWEMADKTRGDVLARMALVPRTMEARGLDVVPSLRDKLAQAGDLAAAGILDIILTDEIGHVAIGNRWYGYLCQLRGLEPVSNYAVLALQYAAPVLRGPFNFPARRAAGFSDHELDALIDRNA
ncbi:MAG: ferritin-like domain-containing protein [Proteobacteria bacterium]|nr:ferritin-like domain-containing protein [Pseudomonadota bacterium]